MRISHGLQDAGMTKNFLKRENVAAVHHEMTGKGVPQHMNRLPLRQVRRDLFKGIAHPRVFQVWEQQAAAHGFDFGI